MSLGKVLVVEDERSLSEALVRKFTHEGFDVMVENNGEDGLSTALREKPDIILLDLKMPKLDGMTALQHLRKDTLYGTDAKVIILTNSYDVDKIGEATNLGVFDYFIKSDSPISEIVTKVKDRLGLK